MALRTNLPAWLLVGLLLLSVTYAAKYYPIEGAAGPGQGGKVFSREDVKTYQPGLLLPSAGLPSPRAVSLSMTAQHPSATYPEKLLSRRNTTAMLTYFGQMLSHDLNKRRMGSVEPGAPNTTVMDIPAKDPWYKPNGTQKSWIIDKDTYVTVGGVAEQVNDATAFIDLSCVYTTSESTLRKLRTMKDGMLVMDPNQKDLALARDVLTEADVAYDSEWVLHMRQYPDLRAAGDSRGNQNPGILALRTLFFRNHNFLAAMLKQKCATCDDESLFQEARRWNIATFQAITYYEYLPQLGIRVPAYSGYQPGVTPAIDNFFSTVAKRYGHSEVTDLFWRTTENGTEVDHGHLSLAEVYYKPGATLSVGIDPLLRGMAHQLQGEVEPHFAVSVQQHLLGPATFNGTDLFATNIFRGRDHGLPGYNAARQAFGLEPKLTWADVTSKQYLQQLLAQAYPKGPNTCDAYVCGLAEDKWENSHFGELFYNSMLRQYLRTRASDPLYFENNGADGPGFTEDEIFQLRSATLRAVILNNTGILSLPTNIWNTGGSVTGSSQGERDARSFRNGEYLLSWNILPDEMEITVNVATQGWVGFGLARDTYSGMLSADMTVISKKTRDGAWEVGDYYSTSKGLVPILDTQRGGASQVRLVSASTVNGRTLATFRKPLKAKDDSDRDFILNGPQPIIFAWHPTDPVFGQPHDPTTRDSAMIDWKTGNSTLTAVKLNKKRRTHGILMAFTFAFLLPLGALLARGLRYNFIQSNGMKAILFYTHIGLQLLGAILATWSFVIALSSFPIGPSKVPFHHGSLGIATMVFVYMQVIVGMVRPPGSGDGKVSSYRRTWDVVHAAFGRLVLLVSIVNVFIGIHLYDTRYVANSFGTWVALTATAVVTIAWGQQVLDRVELLYVAQHLATKRASAMPLDPTISPSEEAPPDHGIMPLYSSGRPEGTKPWSGRKR